MPVPVACVVGPEPGLAWPWFSSLPLLVYSGPLGERTGATPRCGRASRVVAVVSTRAWVGLASEHAASAASPVAATTMDGIRRVMRPPEREGSAPRGGVARVPGRAGHEVGRQVRARVLVGGRIGS